MQQIGITKRGNNCSGGLIVRFEDAELRLLIDGVLASKHISEKHTKDLIEKLSTLSNKYFKSNVKHVYSVKDWDKTEN